MRVTKDNSGQTRSIGIGVEFREVVKDTDCVSTNLDQVSRREAVCPTAPVVIAADRADRRKSPERVQDDRVADVTAMNNEVGTS
jgi:hypothetical protein